MVRKSCFLLLICSVFLVETAAKHVYIPLNQKKCFHENLDKEMVLNGRFKVDFSLPNNIKKEMGMKYDLGVELSITETFDSNHLVYKQNYHFLADSKGNREYYELGIDINSIGDINTFIFTSLDSGDHLICIHPFIKQFNSRRLIKEGFNDKVKVYLDFERVSLSNVMEVITQHNSQFLLTSRLKIDELVKKLNFIKVEQLLFRNSYSKFHVLSNKTNNRIVVWGVVQVVWLFFICFLQLKTLEQLFRRQKVI